MIVITTVLMTLITLDSIFRDLEAVGSVSALFSGAEAEISKFLSGISFGNASL